MRGSSALDQALLAAADVPVRAYVVWLPVLTSDRLPWRPKRRQFADPRILQAWDPDRTVSESLLSLVRAHPDWLPPEDRAHLADPDAIVWDAVMIWPPGARWESLPPPSFYAFPVVDAADQLTAEIRAAAGAPR